MVRVLSCRIVPFLYDFLIFEVTDHLLYDLFIIINFGLVVNWRTTCLSFFLSERCKLEILYQ